MPDNSPSLRQRFAQLLLGSPAPVAQAPRNPVTAAPAPVPVAAPRSDGIAKRALRRLDSIRNTTLGMGDDKITAGRPDMFQIALNYWELSQMWRFGGYARRYVEVLPNDATRKGWDLLTRDGEPIDVNDEHKRLDVISRVCEADTWGRLYGGAWLMMVTDDDIAAAANPHENKAMPLDLTRVRKLKNLIVLDWSEVSVLDWDTRAGSPSFRQPLHYRVSPQVGGWMDPRGDNDLGSGAVVHASRMIYFFGTKLPPQQRLMNDGIDDSVLQSVWNQIRNSTSLDRSLAVLAAEMRISVVKVGELPGTGTGDDAEFFNLRMRMLAQHRSVLNMVLLGPDEEYAHHPGTVAGMGELVGTTRESLQSVTGMPEQLWKGNAPGGLSSDGESHRNLWANVVSSYQTVKLQSLLEKLYAVMFAASEGPWGGNAPDGWHLKFVPLDELTSKGEADLRKIVADTDAIYIDRGVLDPAHVANGRFGAKGWQFELPAIESGAAPLGPDINMEAVLAALAQGGIDPAAPQLPGGQPAPTEPEIPGVDASLTDRRRLAAEMTEAQIRKCEHGKSNRCPMCGIERRRHLVRGEDGSPELDGEGSPAWVVKWAAIGDFDEAEPEDPEAPKVLELRRASGISMDAFRTLLQRHDQLRRRRIPAPWDQPRTDGHEFDVGVWIGLDLPDAARPTWESARLEAATIAGVTMDELDMRGHQPHVTVLWVGNVSKDDAAEMQQRAIGVLDEALADHREIEMQGFGLGAFSPSPASEGDTPMFMALDSSALRQLHEDLAGKLLEDGERHHRPWYEPHSTLGYLPADLTGEQRDALWEATGGRGTWLATEVKLVIGGVVVGRWKLSPRST